MDTVFPNALHKINRLAAGSTTESAMTLKLGSGKRLKRGQIGPLELRHALKGAAKGEFSGNSSCYG